MSGAQIGTVVGGIVGAFFGMPQVGMAIGGLIGGAIDPEVIKAPGIGDAQKQTTSAGVPRPVVYGHPAPFLGNIIDGEHKARKIVVTEGGKGGPEVEQERFLLTSAIRICEGPIAGVARIWRNGDVAADFRAAADIPEYADASPEERLKYISEMRAKTMAFMKNTRIYLGGEDQLPDPALEAIHGVGNTPYYRGTCYMVREDDDVTDTRGACAQYQFEVIGVGVEESVVTIVASTTSLVSGVFGGGGINNFFTGSETYADSGGLSPIDLPFVLESGSGTHPNNHVRTVFTRIDGGPIWDSGWHSASPDQTALNAVLDSEGVPELIGPVFLSDGTMVSPAFYSDPGFGDFIATYYLVNNADINFGVSASIRTANQAEMPSSYTVTPELPGVLIGSDGILYYPDWLTEGGLNAITAGSVTLSSVIDSISDRCGVPPFAIDSDALTDIIPGFLIAVQSTGADCIRPCQQMYFFDMPEFDGQIVAVKRGGASVSTIDDSDMLESRDGDEDTRAQAIEFPLKVSVITRDPAADYNPMPQTSSRYSGTVKALGETQVTSPIPFGADEGAQRSEIIHRVLWAQAEGRSEFELPEEWTRLVPSDCFDRNGKRWLIETVKYADGGVRIEAVYDRASNYFSDATGISAPLPVLPDAGLRGPTLIVAMNLPPLREQDNVAGAYIAVTGTFTGWNGCTVQMSIDGGATYRTVATINQRSTIGRITSEVGPTTEPIPVAIDSGQLNDSTSAELDLGSNAFALVPAAGLSEIGQFQDATEIDVNTYDLTGTRRGVQLTDASTHDSGDRFVMLDNVLFLPIDSRLYGTTLYFRAVTNGTAPEANPPISFLFMQPNTEVDPRITESGDIRTTEAGDRRILE